jgi:hypothetical protein
MLRQRGARAEGGPYLGVGGGGLGLLNGGGLLGAFLLGGLLLLLLLLLERWVELRGAEFENRRWAFGLRDERGWSAGIRLRIVSHD